MKPFNILDYCLTNLEGTSLVESYGEKGIYYNPNRVLKRGIYVLTIKERDGDNDKASNLSRENVFRVNLGLRKETFKKMFGHIPNRPLSGGLVRMGYDYTLLDKIIPHPMYGWMGWISVLNPSESTFEELKPLIQETYSCVQEEFKRKAKEAKAAVIEQSKQL